MLFNNLTITKKLVLMIVLSSIFTLILAVSTILYFNIHTVKQRAIKQISVLGEVIAERSTAALTFFDKAQAEKNLFALAKMQYIELACLFLNDSKLLAEYKNTTRINDKNINCIKEVDFKLSNGIFYKKHLVWGKNIMLDNSSIGYIYIVTDDSFVFDEIYQGITQYLIIIIAVVLLGWFIAYRAQKFISQPIIELENTSRKITREHDFSIRAKKTSNDEIGNLIDTFNIMLNQMQQNEKTLMLQKELLESHQQHLEMEVKQRTSKLQKLNDELSQTLEQLENMQEQLIESEKMASLGALVAGIAHEVNTPIGICLTAASFLQEQNNELNKIYKKDEMSKQIFEDFLLTADHSCEIILKNIQRATEIITNFKKVAIDQSIEEKRCFNLKDYFEEIIKSLHPRLKHHEHNFSIQVDPQLHLDSYPGAFYQIYSNLILNSVIHGFEDNKNGNIEISVSQKNDQLIIEYKDDGKGMTDDMLSKVFEPFATTSRSKGGTGLGAHIVYNIVTQQLHGSICCQSSPGNGVLFKIEIPIALCTSTKG